MNIYRITEQPVSEYNPATHYSDPATYYVVVAETEEQAREIIRANLVAHTEESGKPLAAILEDFDKNYPHVEVSPLVLGVAYKGYFMGTMSGRSPNVNLQIKLHRPE